MKKRVLVLLAAWMAVVMMPLNVWGGTWEQEEEIWRYRQENGSYVSDGWYWIDGKCLYFTPEGAGVIETRDTEGSLSDGTGTWLRDDTVPRQEPLALPQSPISQEAISQNPASQGRLPQDIFSEEPALSYGNMAFRVPRGYSDKEEVDAGTGYPVTMYDKQLDTEEIRELALYAAPLSEQNQARDTVMPGLAMMNVDSAITMGIGQPQVRSLKRFSSGEWHCYEYIPGGMKSSPSLYMTLYARVSDGMVQTVAFISTTLDMETDVWMERCFEAEM